MDYYLAPDVHACSSGELIVFLDLRRDRYFAAPARSFELDTRGRRLCALSEAGDRWGAKLVAQDLVRDSAASSDTSTAPARRVLLLPPSIAFLSALLWARGVVDTPLALGNALTTLRARRGPVAAGDGKKLAKLFASWRPLWPRAYVCLHDTLALAWFLSARGASCDVMFGVQGRPFSAHCWAEIGGEVVNDEPEYCHAFDVILRV
jgi:hypothetical protein